MEQQEKEVIGENQQDNILSGLKKAKEGTHNPNDLRLIEVLIEWRMEEVEKIQAWRDYYNSVAPL